MSVRTGAGGSKAKDNGASAPAPALALSPTPRPSYRQALRLLDAAQKSGDGVPAYTRWVNRRLARFAAAAAASRGVSANGVTFISAAFSAAALACLVLFPATPWVGAGIAVLLAAGYV